MAAVSSLPATAPCSHQAELLPTALRCVVVRWTVNLVYSLRARSRLLAADLHSSLSCLLGEPEAANMKRELTILLNTINRRLLLAEGIAQTCAL